MPSSSRRETCALDLIGAEYVREVEPARSCDHRRPAIASFRPFPRAPRTSCVFEYVYFARPDSRVYGRNVYEVRKAARPPAGREQPVDGRRRHPGARLRRAGGDRLRRGGGPAVRDGPDPQPLRRPHVHRAAAAHPPLRREGEAQPAARACSRGKRVVVVDDSIVRGTTSRKIVKMVRDAGAREVHMRISSPPTIGPCYYGIDTPTRAELIASDALGRGDPRVHHRRHASATSASRASTPSPAAIATASATPASPAAIRCRWTTPQAAAHLFEARER